VSESVTSVRAPSGRSGSLREVVLAGPGAGVAAAGAWHPLEVLAGPGRVRAALAAAGHSAACRTPLDGAVTTVLVLGLCLYSGEGYASVIGRLWPLLGAFNPAVVMWPAVSAAALSQARGRLPAAVVRAVFEAGIAATCPGAGAPSGSTAFGLVLTAVDGTVFDLARADALIQRFATPSGGRYPQARVVTLIECGTRRVLGARIDSCAVSEQRLWDRLVTCLRPGTLNCADRNFFSMDRWRVAAGTGAHLVWRVKNGAASLPATVLATLPDGSHLVRLRESDAMLSRRRTASGQKKAPRLGDITARLVEFTLTVTDEAARTRTSRFRVLTTLLEHEAYPAQQVAACYAERWQAELTYKSIKSTLRGGDRRLRGQAPDLAEQELWGLLAVHNALVDQAVATAVDLGLDPDAISFTVVLRAVRDHLAAHAPCRNCGHHSADPTALTTAIAAGPRNRTDRTRSGPRTKKQRETEHTRDVTYTVTIEESNLPRTT
jgi:hypothetical protein